MLQYEICMTILQKKLMKKLYYKLLHFNSSAPEVSDFQSDSSLEPELAVNFTCMSSAI